jgi:hypothetical protein
VCPKKPSKPPSSFLGATQRIGEQDVPVTSIELEHGVSAGIRLRSLGNNLVPLYEEHEARLERNFGLEAWAAMGADEKALIVAARRIRIAMSNLQSEAEIRAAERIRNK